MINKLKKNKALGILLGAFVICLFATFAMAGKGTKTITTVVDNNDTSYYVVLDSTTGITVGDHFGALVADGTGGLYTVSSIGTAVRIVDNLTEENGGTFGAPVAGSAWYSTPTTNLTYSKPPDTGVGWGPPMRRNSTLVETVLGPTTGLYGISQITTAATGDLFVYGGTNYDKWTLVTPGTSGYVFTSNGAGTLPTWQAAAGGTNALLDASNHTDTVAQAVSRGSIIYGNSTPAWDELTIGGANTVLFSDGTDASWSTLTLAIDGAIGSTRGSVLYRGASGWAILSPGTSGDVLTSQGAGADPAYATPGGGTTHALLSATHTDSTASSVARGSVIVGDSTPKWVQLTVGAANTVVASDGTDTTFTTVDTLLDQYSSTHGAVLFRGASGWEAIAPSTSGLYLRTNGSGVDPVWSAPAGGSTNELLDASNHTDTAAASAARGAVIIGNASAAWARVTVGAANTVVASDGTDTTFTTMTSLLDGAFGSTQGQILYRGASGWQVLATGTAGYVLHAGGAGADIAWVDSGGGAGTTANGYIHLQQQETSGTAGGTATSGSWERRDLNTEVADTGNNCTLDTVTNPGRFTLDAGTYEITATLSFRRIDAYQARLYNITDASSVVLGVVGNSDSTANSPPERSMVRGRFTIAGSKDFEVQSQVQTTASTTGYGVASSFGTEVYVDVVIHKINH